MKEQHHFVGAHGTNTSPGHTWSHDIRDHVKQAGSTPAASLTRYVAIYHQNQRAAPHKETDSPQRAFLARYVPCIITSHHSCVLHHLQHKLYKSVFYSVYKMNTIYGTHWAKYMYKPVVLHTTSKEDCNLERLEKKSEKST